MDWAIVIGIIITAIGSFATAIQAWVAWKQHRLEEAERLRQFTPPPRPAPPDNTPKFPTTYTQPPAVLNPPAFNIAGVNLASEVGADYTKLRDLLVARKYKEADLETNRIMVHVSLREKEGWLDIEAIENFPCQDLRTIDQLWIQSSNGRFGFSVQKEIYHQVGKNYDKFAEEVKWLVAKKWKKYDEFIFDVRAPRGHLPTTSRVWLSDGFLVFISSLASRLVKCNI